LVARVAIALGWQRVMMAKSEPENMEIMKLE